MELQTINNKLWWYSYIHCKALDFELNHPRVTLRDRAAYFLGCRAYEVLIHFHLESL